VKECLDKIQEMKKELFGEFNSPNLGKFTHIEDNLHCPWYMSGGSIEFIDASDLYSYESGEIVAENKLGEVLVVVRDNGKRFYAIFDQELEGMTEEEFYGWCEEKGVDY